MMITWILLMFRIDIKLLKISTTVNCNKNNITGKSNLNNSRKNSLSNQNDNNNLNNSKKTMTKLKDMEMLMEIMMKKKIINIII